MIPIPSQDDKAIPKEISNLYKKDKMSNMDKWIYVGRATAQKTDDDPTLVSLEIHSYCEANGKTSLKLIDIE